MVFSGCGLLGVVASPPSERHELRLYPHQVRYVLMSHVTGKACSSGDELESIKDTKSSDPRAIGPGYLFERAKFEALEKAPSADGLIAIRSRVDVTTGKNSGQCVTVIGRAYRITHLAAGPAIAGEKDDEGEAPLDDRGEEEKRRAAPNDEL